MNKSTSITPHSRRVFTSLLLAFSILITPIAAMAGTQRSEIRGQRSEQSSTSTATQSGTTKAAAKDVFVNPPVAAPPVGSVTATMTGTITTDVDSDTKADPGVDTITYTTTITNNTGADVSGLQFTDTVDPHTTIISGSAVAAGDDAYSTIGNVNINLPLAQGVLANDFNPNTGNNTGLTVSSYGASTGLEQTSVGSSTPTAQGGTITIQSDGSFIFDPKVGFTGTDTFKYASNQSGSKAIATVRITVTGMIWFVKNDAAACTTISTPCGTLAQPFSTLAAFQAVNDAGAGPPQHPKANDNIFIYTGVGNYTGGVTLLSGQKLIGQGAPASIEIITGLSTPSGSTVLPATGGTNPQITNTTANSDAITLNDGNTVEGLTVTGATRDGIAGASHAGLTANTVTIQNNTASGLHLTSMTGTVTITNATISGNASGLDVDNGTATITVTNSTISGNGTGLDVNNGTTAISLNNTNTITANAAQRQVSIQNRPLTAGTIDVGAIINDSAVGSTGILINSNTSGTINFTGSQTLRTTTNTAVNLTTNTGTTINFSGTLGITTTTGI
ncbi:MAG TPA: right-handed parallel beta-helix repeat-containing protein, partial [Pyrinomonadaceae bacterium]|nr:right-handed parallel beta-helix repeat-containing protein [Pyrinomonadaceae bacterium]